MQSLCTRFAAALAVSFIFFVFIAPASAQAPYEVVIAGGRVVDGTGNPWYRADVGIRDGRIAAIGDLRQAQAARRIDAVFDHHSVASIVSARRTVRCNAIRLFTSSPPVSVRSA